jgi:DNA helicase-2/ATP-dependent DNA helicase PcrA
MRQDTPDKAINRIMHYMGYADYLERQSIDDSKVFILRQIAKREATIESFLNRLEELKTLIQTKENDYTCPFILSTIHSSKGLEYTNVYLIDVTDGVFPESVPIGRTAKQMKKEELETYEEERRLFYVGVTRAKNTLTILKAPGTSSFVNQLLKGERAFAAKSQIKKKDDLRKEKNSQKNFSKMKYKGTSSDIIDDSSFDEVLRGLTEGQVVTHKKYGEGVIIGFDNPYVYIRFDQTKKAFNLVRLMESGALKFI